MGNHGLGSFPADLRLDRRRHHSFSERRRSAASSSRRDHPAIVRRFQPTPLGRQQSVSSPPIRCDSPGEVFVIENGMAWSPIYVDCSDLTVNTERVLGPNQSLRASPDSVASCRFSDGKDVWSYPFDIPAAERSRQRRRRTCGNDCSPDLFFLEISENRALVIGDGEDARFTGIPMAPFFYDLDQLSPREKRRLLAAP